MARGGSGQAKPNAKDTVNHVRSNASWVSRDVQVVSDVTERRTKSHSFLCLVLFGLATRPTINNFQFKMKMAKMATKQLQKMCTIIYEKCSSLNLNLHPFLINSHISPGFSFRRFSINSFICLLELKFFGWVLLYFFIIWSSQTVSGNIQLLC